MMRSVILAALLAACSAAPAHADMRRAERALDGPAAAFVDPGPPEAKIGIGSLLIRILPAHEVRALCPASFDYHSRACTLKPSNVILMPDEESSGLTTEQWLAELRHEILHALGLDWHPVRP
jgi:hypothetical protein